MVDTYISRISPDVFKGPCKNKYISKREQHDPLEFGISKPKKDQVQKEF